LEIAWIATAVHFRHPRTGLLNRAADLEELRRALMADRLVLLSWSAGTEVALETIRRYGDRIEAVILAGTVGPDNILSLPSTADLHFAPHLGIGLLRPGVEGISGLFRDNPGAVAETGPQSHCVYNQRSVH